MENTPLVVLLSALVLAQVVSSLVVAGLFRKVGQLMATQAELKNALDVTSTDLDAIKAVVDKLVANGGGQNVMTQAELDAFVTSAQAIRAKADAVVEAIKPLDPGEPPPPGSAVTSGGTARSRR